MSYRVQLALKKNDAVTTPVGKLYRSLDSAIAFARSIVERGHAYRARVVDADDTGKPAGLTLWGSWVDDA
jgi:hypothetical protein